MDVAEAIAGQRAVRRFAARPLEPEHLRAILDAGRLAPSSKNEQRWDFVVCSNREHLAELAAVGDYAGHLAGAAVAVALVTPEAEEGWRRESIAFDLGQCAQNMMLAAWELGVGSVHAAVYDEQLAAKLLGLPPGRRCDYLLSFGYPARQPAAPPLRRPFDDVVHRERW